MKIVIVDNNPAMHKVLATLFESKGHQVPAALEDGSALIEAVRQYSPDLVCLDAHLSGQGGLALLAETKSMFPNIAVVMMIGQGDQDFAKSATDAGAIGFLRKPFTQSQILDELKRVEATLPTADKPVMQESKALKIIVVDDNLAINKVLSALFESYGHQVVAALGDGSKLFECARQYSPDLVCLDYNLPGRNGLDLLIELNASFPDIAVVMLTGSSDRDLVGKAADAGAIGFLHKPFTQSQILDELRGVNETLRLGGKAASRENKEAPPATECAKRTVVIVDDSGSIRMLLRGMLESLGLTVVQMVGSGRDGIDAAKRYRPEIVTLDVEMPGMSGLEALPLIQEASPNSKIVMVTGNADKKFIESAIAGGAKGYILKPLRHTHVEAYMQKLLA